LRGALEAANSNDTILFNVEGIILLDSQLIVDKNLYIMGPGADRLTLSGQAQDRIFEVGVADTLNLSGLDLAFGDVTSKNDISDPPLGGLIFCQGVIIASDCIFRSGSALDGGGVLLDGASGRKARIELENCAFYDNVADGDNPTFLKIGGAIAADARNGGEAIVIGTNVTFVQNRAQGSGGAIYLIGDPAGGARLECTNCTIGDNEGGRAGGVDNSQAEGSIIKNSIISANRGTGIERDYFGTIFSQGNNIFGVGGGGTLVDQATDFLETDPLLGPFGFNSGTIPVKTLQCESPAIDNGDDSGAPTLDSRGQARIGTSDIGAYERNDLLDLAVTNLMDDGGGSLRQAIELTCPDGIIDLSQITGRLSLASPLHIRKNITIQGNTQDALMLDGNDTVRILEIDPDVTLDLSHLTLENGGSQGSTGGGAILNYGNLDIQNVTFLSCEASSGGAIGNYALDSLTNIRLENCTFTQNRARDLDGGAIDNRAIGNNAAVELINCTFADNQALNRGGALNNIGGLVSLKNTVVANNNAFEGQDGFGMFLSLGNNLVKDTVEMRGIDQATDLIALDPLLGSLRVNVGPTPVFIPQASSPLIDAGQNDGVAMTDQLGSTRIVNGQVDIGSVEFLPGLPIDSKEVNAWLKVYPNPVSDVLYISPEIQGGSAITIKLYTIEGKPVRTTIWSLSAKGETFSWDLRGLAVGKYCVVAQRGASISRQMIIITHE
ncbi:MAG: choice-of-anchor Q domain-containing protein, partial [Bacteroidota bacterium]